MAGWVLMRFDKDGKMLWSRQLPAACPGMDVIPGGGGVMLVNQVGERRLRHLPLQPGRLIDWD
jgi:hypothetical protein